MATDPILTVTAERNGEVGLMRLAGELDMGTHGQVLDVLRDDDMAGVGQWAIDCSDLTFVDSGGLRAILAVAGEAGGLDSLALYEPQPQLMKLLDATGLSEQLTIRTNLDEPPQI